MYEELGWGPHFCFLHLPGKGGRHFIWKRIPPKPSFHLGKAGLWRSSREARRYVFPDSRWLSTLFTFPDSVQLRFTCSCLQWAMLIKSVLYWHRNTCRNSSWFIFSVPLPHSASVFCNQEQHLPMMAVPSQSMLVFLVFHRQFSQLLWSTYIKNKIHLGFGTVPTLPPRESYWDMFYSSLTRWPHRIHRSWTAGTRDCAFKTHWVLFWSWSPTTP